MPLANRVVEVPLTEVGGTDEVTLQISASAGTVATPTATPHGATYLTFPKTVVLMCSTAGATIEYQLPALYGALGGVWQTYSGPISVARNRTLYARAIKVAMTDSATIAEHYIYESEAGGGRYVP